MNDAAHHRWQGIVERETLGEPISADDRRFRDEYEGDHAECADESEAWGALLSALGGDQSEGTGQGDDELAAKILAAARGSTSAGAVEREAATIDAIASATSTAAAALATSTAAAALATSTAAVLPLQPRRPITAALGGVAAITAAAAALALWWRGEPVEDESRRPTIAEAESTSPTRTHPPVKIPEAPAKIPEAPTKIAAGESAVVAMASPSGVKVDGVALMVGMALEEGASIRAEEGACLVFRAPFAAVCLGAGAEAKIASTRDGVREIDLTRGRLVATLDPVGPGQSFTVTTTGGRARAIGTVFAVEVAGPKIDVGVVEGKIEVRKVGADAGHRLLAGERTKMADPGTTSLLDGEFATWSKGHSDLSALWRGDAEAGPIEIDEARGLSLALDGVALPARGDLALLVAAGPHALIARGARGEPRTRMIVADPAAPLRLSRVDLAGRAGPRSSSGGEVGADIAPLPVEPTPRGPTIDELRKAAADARGERRWQDAAAAYRSLVDAYPGTPAADNARYQLADLLRVRLGRPDDALALYDAYLTRGGPLAAEARVGKIRCLQALGRADEERAAIAEYLDRHPDHIEVEKFRQRARELDR